jgi:hypothetical protein
MGEQTEALKTLLGEYYVFDHDHWLVALFKTHKNCKYVDDDGDVVFFKNQRGVAQRKVHSVLASRSWWKLIDGQVSYESADSGVDANM